MLQVSQHLGTSQIRWCSSLHRRLLVCSDGLFNCPGEGRGEWDCKVREPHSTLRRRSQRWSSRPPAQGDGDEVRPWCPPWCSPTWTPPLCTSPRWSRSWRNDQPPIACTTRNRYCNGILTLYTGSSRRWRSERDETGKQGENFPQI